MLLVLSRLCVGGSQIPQSERAKELSKRHPIHDSVKENIRKVMDRILSFKSQHKESRRPFVTLTYAQSLDGKIAIFLDDEEKKTSSNFPISGNNSLLLTHGLRSIHDAILVGGRTLAIDNPRLSNRLWGEDFAHQPRPVVMDTHLRYFTSIFGICRATNPIICCSKEAAFSCKKTFPGVTLLPCQLDDEGRIDLNLLLPTLFTKFGIQSIMVEGGSKILTSFAEKKLIDCLCVTISPKILGTKGLPVFSNKFMPKDFDLVTPLFFPLGEDNVLLSKWLVD
jgi:riboflavin-specific deaminase-like protein